MVDATPFGMSNPITRLLDAALGKASPVENAARPPVEFTERERLHQESGGTSPKLSEAQAAELRVKIKRPEPHPLEDILRNFPHPPESCQRAIAARTGTTFPKSLVAELAVLDTEWVQCQEGIMNHIPGEARKAFLNQGEDLHKLTAVEIGRSGHRTEEEIANEFRARMKAFRARQKDIAAQAQELIKPVAFKLCAAAEVLATKTEDQNAALYAEFGLQYTRSRDFLTLSILKSRAVLLDQMKHDPIGRRPRDLMAAIPVPEETSEA